MPATRLGHSPPSILARSSLSPCLDAPSHEEGTGEKGMKRRKRKDTKPSRTLPLAASFSGLDEDHTRCCSIAHHILEGPRTGELGSPV